LSPPTLGQPVPALRDDQAAIVLRPWQQRDAAALVAAWGDPAIAAHCGVPPDAGPARAEVWVSGWAERAERGISLDLVVADAATDAVLGEVGVWPFQAPPDDARVSGVLELGWWIGAPHRGAGLARAAVRLLADWALPALGAQKLVARIRRGHSPSEAVARGAGLVRRGPLDADCDLWVRSAATMPS
jgi:RimJ/RimL family protein N-acetyltransferase